MHKLDDIVAAVRREARRAAFPVDEPVYAKAGRDPGDPTLCVGSPDAAVCIFARDLGKDEVALGQPLIGAGGRIVRATIHRVVFGTEVDKTDRRVEAILPYILMTNTVPYKPPGNKAYGEPVKERFRPFLEQLLLDYWMGQTIVTLGTEAFDWFRRYEDVPGRFDEFWSREDRYASSLAVTLTAKAGRREIAREIRLAPLPHPSPLNQRWFKAFPGLLAARLKEAGLAGAGWV